MTKSPSDIDHLSASSMRLYMSCPRQWAAVYLDQVPGRTGAALIKGKAVDAAATANWRQKPRTGRDLPAADALEVAEGAFYEDVDKAGGRGEVDWGGSDFGKDLDSTIRLTRRHMADHAPLYTPVAVQERFIRRLPDGRDVLGFIDAVLNEDRTELLDVKTGGRRMPQGDADRDIQASAYLWASGRSGVLHFARVIHRAGRVQADSEIVTTYRTAANCDAFEEQASNISAAIDNGVFPRIAGWHCSYCPVSNACPVAGAGGNNRVATDAQERGLAMATASVWGSLSRTARVGGGDGDWPLIEPDLYDGEVIEVSEPTDEANKFKPGEMQTRFYLTWRLADQETHEEVGTLRQYLNLPNGYIHDGVLSEKSGLYLFMKSLNLIEDEDAIDVNPPSWVGLKARVATERYETQDGRERDRVSKVMPPRKKREAAAAAPARASSGLKGRLAVVEEDDDEE